MNKITNYSTTINYTPKVSCRQKEAPPANSGKTNGNDVVCFSGNAPTKPDSALDFMKKTLKTVLNKIFYFPSFIGDNYIGKPAKIYWEKVDDQLYRCSKPTKETMQELQKNGVKVIIDLKNSNKENKLQEMQLAKEFGIKYVHIKQSAFFPPTKKEVETIFSYMKEGPLAIHCKNGRDRTGLVVGLYRKQKYGWDYEKAEKEMEKYGFNPKIYPLLNYYLKHVKENFTIPELKQTTFKGKPSVSDKKPLIKAR